MHDRKPQNSVKQLSFSLQKKKKKKKTHIHTQHTTQHSNSLKKIAIIQYGLLRLSSST